MKRWTKERVLEEIIEAHENGVGIGTGQAQKNSLRQAYRANNYNKFYSTWKDAVAAAGIDLDEHRAAEEKVKREKRKKQLLEDIRESHENGVSLRASDLQNDPENRNLYERAKSLYDGGRLFWETVLRDADIDPDNIVSQRGWDKERIKEEIIRRYNDGQPLNAGAVKKEDSGLKKAGRIHFRRWDLALEYAGIKVDKVRQREPTFSDQEIIQQIISHDMKGSDLNETRIVKGKNKQLKRLMWRARKRFGSWADAVNTAGIEYDQFRERKPRGSWTKDQVINEIIELDREGIPLNAANISTNNNPLYKGALRCMGSWKNAIESAGLDYSSTRKSSESKSEEELTSAIQSLHNACVDINPSAMQSNSERAIRSMYMMACRKFGSWRKAVEAAGIDYKDVCERPQHTHQELVELVNNLHAEGRSLRAIDIQRDPNISKYHKAALNRYDSWYDFIEDIGIDPTPYRQVMNWTPDNIIAGLKEEFQSGIVRGVKNKHPKLANAALRHFGSIEEATRKASMIYAPHGVTKAMLEQDSSIMGTIYKFNKEFLQELARKAYFVSRKFTRNSLPIEDLEQEALMVFYDNLSEVPKDEGVREFLGKKINAALGKMNRDHFKEVRIDDERTLDFFDEEYGHLV